MFVKEPELSLLNQTTPSDHTQIKSFCPIIYNERLRPDTHTANQAFKNQQKSLVQLNLASDKNENKQQKQKQQPNKNQGYIIDT